MSFSYMVERLQAAVWNWPLLLLLALISILFTFFLYGVQFRYFFTSWKLAFFSSDTNKKDSSEPQKNITTFEAFINSLGASIGNGNITGIPVAIHLGGPGAAFWMLIAGFLGLSLRFAEVYLGTFFTDQTPNAKASGGPMLYLSKVPAGRYLPYIYTALCLIYTLVAGNGMQCNAISLGCSRTWSLSPILIGTILTIFIIYVLLGGARRIINISDKLVPLKVGLFLLCSSILLIYHSSTLIEAFQLMCIHAFKPTAIAGASVGITAANAISQGVSKGINASEIGLGTASVIFGGAQSQTQNPVHKGILSMLSAFITIHIICFIVALSVVASGVWNAGETSTAMTISAYETVFGAFGGWIVTAYTLFFGLSVVVSYAYIAQECWFFLTQRRFKFIFIALYTTATFLGCLCSVSLVWNMIDIVNAAMLLINLFGISCLIKIVQRGLKNKFTEEKMTQFSKMNAQ